MNRQIWKYTLGETEQFKMPKGAEILTAQTQGELICIWALVDPLSEKEDRYFEVFGTGENIPYDMGIERKHIGTVQFANGLLIWHVFERIN